MRTQFCTLTVTGWDAHQQRTFIGRQHQRRCCLMSPCCSYQRVQNSRKRLRTARWCSSTRQARSRCPATLMACGGWLRRRWCRVPRAAGTDTSVIASATTPASPDKRGRCRHIGTHVEKVLRACTYFCTPHNNRRQTHLDAAVRRHLHPCLQRSRCSFQEVQKSAKGTSRGHRCVRLRQGYLGCPPTPMARGRWLRRRSCLHARSQSLSFHRSNVHHSNTT